MESPITGWAEPTADAVWPPHKDFRLGRTGIDKILDVGINVNSIRSTNSYGIRDLVDKIMLEDVELMPGAWGRLYTRFEDTPGNANGAVRWDIHLCDSAADIAADNHHLIYIVVHDPTSDAALGWTAWLCQLLVAPKSNSAARKAWKHLQKQKESYAACVLYPFTAMMRMVTHPASPQASVLLLAAQSSLINAEILLRLEAAKENV